MLSTQSIDALAEVISGGAANNPTPPIAFYRSGPQIEKFMRGCNIDFKVTGSRVPDLVECLANINRDDQAKANLTRIIEASVDSRDFLNEPEKHQVAISYLNERLAYDGLELQKHGIFTRLAKAGQSSPILDSLTQKAKVINFDTVQRDLNRASESVEKDPEDAVTSACCTLESVCRSILIELGLSLPARKDISSLYKAIREPLGLSPDRSDFPQEIANDIQKILSGFITIVEGIGALRTHSGDAHGREKGYRRIDSRIARLAIHAASTFSLFIIETWEKKYPSKTLHFH